MPSRTSAPTPALDQTNGHSDHPREGAPTLTPPHRGSSQVLIIALQVARRTFYAWATRAPSKRSMSRPSPKSWPASTSPTRMVAARRSRCTGRRRCGLTCSGRGFPVAKSTVERLMRRHGWKGVCRQKSVRTTIADPTADRAPDLVDHQFRVPTPNVLVVADFTYVKLVTGVFAYVEFVIDAYAGTIIGWEAASTKPTRFVESAIRQAAALGARQGHRIDGAIHHLMPDDSTSQYVWARRSPCRGCGPRSEASVMPTTTRWPRRPSGSTRTDAFAPIHRFGAARYATSPTSSSSPPTTSPGLDMQVIGAPSRIL
ncbi:hypothetical protein ACVWWN_000366 [Mycobacterium sp. URHB0021]